MVKKTWKQNEEAVSPIVATLLLVLVTVAAAVGFYAWFGDYQDATADSAGDVDFADYETILIAGSSTVYEFSTVGAERFTENYSDYKVSVQSGGSGAGKTSVANGLVDIGSSSSALDDDDKTEWPDMVETLVGYDAVVLVVPTANTHGLVSMNELDLQAIYYANGGAAATADAAIQARITALDIIDTDGTIQWNEVPTTAAGGAFCTGTEDVNIYDRADHSGTEETFAKKVLDCGKNTIEEVGINTGNSYPSNQEIISKLKEDVDGFGFMAYGLAKNNDNGLAMIAFEGDKGLVDPTTGSTFINTVVDGEYDGGRSLVYLTMGEPEGKAKVYIDYVRTPWANIQICAAAGYISLYN